MGGIETMMNQDTDVLLEQRLKFAKSILELQDSGDLSLDSAFYALAILQFSSINSSDGGLYLIQNCNDNDFDICVEDHLTEIDELMRKRYFSVQKITDGYCVSFNYKLALGVELESNVGSENDYLLDRLKEIILLEEKGEISRTALKLFLSYSNFSKYQHLIRDDMVLFAHRIDQEDLCELDTLLSHNMFKIHRFSGNWIVVMNAPIKDKEPESQEPKFDKFKEHRKRAKHFDVPGQGDDGLTQAQWNAILKKYGRRCLACGATDEKLHIDHVIPLSKGGGNVKENIQPLCAPCNIKKSTDSTDYRIDYK